MLRKKALFSSSVSTNSVDIDNPVPQEGGEWGLQWGKSNYLGVGNLDEVGRSSPQGRKGRCRCPYLNKWAHNPHNARFPQDNEDATSSGRIARSALPCGASMGKNDIESLKRPSLPSSGGQPGRDESSCLFDSLSPRPAKTSSAFSNSRFFHRRFSSLMQTMSNRPFVHSLYAHSHSTTIRPLFFGHPIKPTLQAWSLFVQSFPSEQLGLHSRLLKGDECLILL